MALVLDPQLVTLMRAGPALRTAGKSKTDQAAEVARLGELGAKVVRHHRDPDDDFVVMTDPEGNEFCVCAVVS